MLSPEVRDSYRLPASYRSARLGTLASRIAASGPIVLLSTFALTMPMTFGLLPYSVINPTQLGLVYFIVAVWVSCFVRVAAVSPPPGSASIFWTRVGMTTLALLAPIAVVLSIRLSVEACLVMNPLFLPWPDAVKVAVRVASALVVVASTALIVRGFWLPQLRDASKRLSIYSALFVIPAGFLLFLTVYGDPGPNCIPV